MESAFCVTRAGNSSPNPILFSWELLPEPSLWGVGGREGDQSNISAIPLGSPNCQLWSVDFGKGHSSYRGRSYQPGVQKWAHENGMTGLSSFIFPSPTVWAPLPPPQLRGPKEPPSGGEPEGPLLPALPGWCSWPPPGPVSIVAVMLGECLCRAGGRRRSSPSGGLDSGTLSQTSSHEPNTPLSPAVIGHPCGEAKAQRFRAHQGHTTC